MQCKRSLLAAINRFTLSVFGLIFLFINTEAKTNDEAKFILIHLDAASSHYLLEEMEKGNLPNLQSYFDDENHIKYTITYFPSKTPTVISSLRIGDSVREANLPGWEWIIDNVEGTVVKTAGTFLRMILSTSRLSTTNILYGVPAFHWLAGPALVNTADYLKDYNILQFYWYNIDTQGHFNGEMAYRKEYADFDKHFGSLMNRLDDDVNIIIYSDHGMTFGEGVEIDTVLEELIGDDLKVYSYPSLYLKYQEKAEYFSWKIMNETAIDFTFFKSDANTLRGYHKDGTIIFNKNYEDLTIQYQYIGEDVLEYYSNGYNGEFLNEDEWLSLTHNFEYPLAPVLLYHYMENPGSGDIITLFDETKYHKTAYSSAGNHGGFTDTDMRSLLMAKGPDVSSLYGKNYYWLPNLFNDIQGIDFDRRPPRERHYFSSRYDFINNRTVTDYSMSPLYRIRYGATTYNSDFNKLSNYDSFDIWGKADLYRSYLTRLWIGTGIEISPDNIDPLFLVQYDIQIRKFVLQNTYSTNRRFQAKLSYEATRWLAIESVNFTSIGLRFDF